MRSLAMRRILLGTFVFMSSSACSTSDFSPTGPLPDCPFKPAVEICQAKRDSVRKQLPYTILPASRNIAVK